MSSSNGLPPSTFESLDAQVQAYIRALNSAHDQQYAQVQTLSARNQQLLEANELASQRTKAPKLPDPRTYDGVRNTRALKDYLYDLEQQFNNEPAKFAGHATKIRYAASYLKGTARLWFQNQDESGDAPWTTFDEYTEHLKKAFGELDPLSYWLKKWDQLQQRGSVNHYLAEFSSVAAQLDMTDQAKYHQFKKGLRSNVQDHLALMPQPETFDDLVKIANQIDARFYEHQRNKAPSFNQRNQPCQQQSNRYNNNFGPRQGNNNAWKPRYPATTTTISTAPATYPNDVPMQLDNLQAQGPQQGYRPPNLATTKCYNCGRPGHISKNCFLGRQGQSSSNGPRPQSNDNNKQ